jgi:hypothetical protein
MYVLVSNCITILTGYDHKSMGAYMAGDESPGRDPSIAYKRK